MVLLCYIQFGGFSGRKGAFMALLLILALYVNDPEEVFLEFSALAKPLTSAAFVEEFDHPENPVDILHYDVSLEVFEELQEIAGVTVVQMAAKTFPVSSVRLDLRQLEADSVWCPSGPLAYYQQEDSIFITLGQPLNPGDTTEVHISYGGAPYHESWGGFWFGNVITYHIGVGIYTPGQCMGKCMFPCWDHQNDKASFDFHITCDQGDYAVANGDSAGVEIAGGKATFHWTMPQQMPTYLVGMNVGDYEVLHDSTDARIYYYVYSWDVPDALGSFVNVDLMLANLEGLFGEYPWDCRFSLVETPKGDMEHVSHVTHVAQAVNGNTSYDWLIAHEMTHHWWGCCVTPGEWQHIWLKEGFATLGEALWMETYGQEAYDEYMVNQIMKPYLNSGEIFPISQPSTPAEIFSATTYDKAGAVLHMLRYVLGDGPFFETLNQYFQDHMFGLVWTDDFRDDIETYTGEDIDWFFDTWIHGWGYPVYDVTHAAEQSGGDWEITIDVAQTQTTQTIFEMPLEFLVQGTSADTVLVMWNDQQQQSESWLIPFEPVEVTFDPFHHILCGNILTGIEDYNLPPGGLSTAWVSPNPAAVNVSVHWPGAEALEIRARVFDMSGRLVREASLPPSDRILSVSGLPPGVYLLQLTGETGVRQTSRLVVAD